MHFVRLATTLLKDEQSALDNHLFAFNFAKYRAILFFFTDKLSNKAFLIWLLTIPLHLKYVATLPCYLSLIACFLTLMFHNVVLQRMLFLITILLQIYQRIYQRKRLVNRFKIWQNCGHEFGVSFLAQPDDCTRLQRGTLSRTRVVGDS